MLCNNCHKVILQVEEVKIKTRIKDLIFCKVCVKEIENRCHFCHCPIYKYDLFHETYSNWGFFAWFFNIGNSEKFIQCNDCFKMWIKKKREWEMWWKWRKWILFFLAVISLISGLYLFSNLENISSFRSNPISTSLFLSSLVIINIIFYSSPMFPGRWNFYPKEKDNKPKN